MACDLCSVYSATQARGEVGEGLYAGLAEQFSHFATVQVDGRKVSNEAGQYLDSSISQLFAGYNLNNRFGVQFNLPVIYRSFKRPEGFEINRGTESGIGDVSLIGNFLAYRTLTENFTFSWSVLGGIKFPTGSTDRIKEEFNEVEVPGAPESGIHGHDLTLGTGSFDGIFGAQSSLRYKNFFAEANGQFTLRGDGAHQYHFANDLIWSAGPGYYPVRKRDTLIGFQCVASGESKDVDRFQGRAAEDTGVTSVFIGPRIIASHDQLSGELAEF